jgi:arylsulfatase A-like enzyme
MLHPARPPANPCVLAFLVLAIACGGEVDVAPEPACRDLARGAVPADANLIVIVNDTNRRDRMGAYGGPARTTAFDGFARDHLLFERAFTQSPWTKPSVATLFTSLYPSQHRVADDPQIRSPFDVQRSGPLQEADVLAPELDTLAEVVRRAGFRTAAFVSNPWMEKRFGFDQGFELYDDSFARWGTPGEVVSRAALAWLAERQPGERFFAYLHYLDSHLPYGLLRRDEVARRAAELAADRRPLSEQAKVALQMVPRYEDGQPALAAGAPPVLGLIEMAYDAGLEKFDRALGQFLEAFARHPAWARTAIVVTSDHGEALFAHGWGNHGLGLHDDEVAVPFAARLPGVTAQGGRVGCLVGLVDVLPSMCAYLDVPCAVGAAGVSFVPSPTGAGSPPPRWMVSEGVAKQPSHRAVRNASYKLLWETGPRGDGKVKENPYSLYDVRADPAETVDLLAAPQRSRGVETAFRTMSEALPGAVPALAAPAKRFVPVDEAMKDRLKALGYTN